MPKLRRLSGDDVVTILSRHGFNVHSQRGSHVKLKRIGPAGLEEILTVPRHRELDPGTLLAILRQASRFIPSETLREEFYSE